MRDKYNEALRGYVVGTHLIEPWHFISKEKGRGAYRTVHASLALSCT